MPAPASGLERVAAQLCNSAAKTLHTHLLAWHPIQVGVCCRACLQLVMLEFWGTPNWYTCVCGSAAEWSLCCGSDSTVRCVNACVPVVQPQQQYCCLTQSVSLYHQTPSPFSL
jgi:hypothetical protein